jgi:hypothetical protein
MTTRRQFLAALTAAPLPKEARTPPLPDLLDTIEETSGATPPNFYTSITCRRVKPNRHEWCVRACSGGREFISVGRSLEWTVADIIEQMKKRSSP